MSLIRERFETACRELAIAGAHLTDVVDGENDDEMRGFFTRQIVNALEDLEQRIENANRQHA